MKRLVLFFACVCALFLPQISTGTAGAIATFQQLSLAKNNAATVQKLSAQGIEHSIITATPGPELNIPDIIDDDADDDDQEETVIAVYPQPVSHQPQVAYPSYAALLRYHSNSFFTTTPAVGRVTDKCILLGVFRI